MPAAVGPVQILVGVLVLAVVFMTIYVLESNTISSRKAKIATLQTQAAQEKAAADKLSTYTSLAKIAQARAQTVRQIASNRFDWHRALSELSMVVPSNTSLQSLLGTVAPGASVSGAGGNAGASTGSVRGGITAPAFEIKGCTSSHDDVARLMSRLRLMDDVTRVTLTDSQKSDTPAVTTSGTSGSAIGCGANKPSFDLAVFFKAIPGAGPNGVTSTTGTQRVSTPGAPATPPASSSAASSSSSSSRSVSTPSSGAAK